MGKKWAPRTSWRDKLENPADGLPKVVEVSAEMEQRMGGRRILIPLPLDVEALVRTVPKGRLISTPRIRQRLAEDARADSTCPLTLGIFLRIISEAAEEDLSLGKKRITPYWRVVKANGSLNPKYPGGTEAQAERLRQEGHTVLPAKGKAAPKIADFEKSLV